MANQNTHSFLGSVTNDPPPGRPEKMPELLHDPASRTGQAHDLQMLMTDEVCERPYWTRTAIKTFLKPDRTEFWRYHGVGSGIRYLYSLAQIEAVESTPDFATWKSKKIKRDEQAEVRRIHAVEKAANEQEKAQTAKEGRMAAYDLQYAVTDPVPDVARTLFELNRLAKHPTCSLRDRDHIYDLKHDVIGILYQDGYSTDCYLHTTILPVKSCFGCDGSGYEGDDNGTIWGKCYRCNGTGLYLPAKPLAFVVFHFLIGDQRYCWHTPQELVTFQYQITKETADYSLSEELKPVDLPSISESTELLEWFVSRKSTTLEALADGAIQQGEDHLEKREELLYLSQRELAGEDTQSGSLDVPSSPATLENGADQLSLMEGSR